METIMIPLSKRKLFMLLIGSVLFVVAGVFFLIKPATFLSPLMQNERFIAIIGSAAILFFGFCAVFAAKKMFDNRPGLIIDQLGITDNSSGVGGGVIPWNEIDGISTAQVQSQRFILVMVSDPDKYIAAQHGSFKRRMMKINYRMYNTPVCISANGLQTNFDELYNLITTQFQKHRK
jgi:hypothetical protein